MIAKNPTQKMWEEFAKHAIPPDATEAQRHAMKAAFFAGAYGFYSLVIGFQDRVEKDKPSREKHLLMSRQFAATVVNEFEGFFNTAKEDAAANDKTH